MYNTLIFDYLPSESPNYLNLFTLLLHKYGDLTALLDELIIAISSHLTKPPDHLHFAMLNHHTYTLINAVLYKGVVLNHTTYHVIQHANINGHHPLQQKLWHLTNHLNTTPPLRPIIKTLGIHMHSSHSHPAGEIYMKLMKRLDLFGEGMECKGLLD
ncbi:hypothetical protein OEA41_006210 [Lepraria neglecta]|uniref:Uncharacterized protein n=1 Tax=Lepraria neglecta TaxID=209136 RepID=A0AAE0DKQ9_9LECA|nr:hypothetical protein OEA41_006210 [Lepraria neglecta]